MEYKYNGLQLVLERHGLYFGLHNRLIFLNIGLIGLIILIIYLIHYVNSTTNLPRYFPTTPDGQVIQTPGFSQPYLSDPELIEWVKKVGKLVYSFDYVNYRPQMQQLRPYFTTAGYQNYLNAILESNNLESIKSRQQTITVTLDSEPVITRRGLNSKLVPPRYSWEVRYLLTVHFYSPGDLKPLVQKLKAEMILVRESTLLAPSGVAIYRFIFEDANQ